MLLDREGSHRKHRELQECRILMLLAWRTAAKSIEKCKSAGS